MNGIIPPDRLKWFREHCLLPSWTLLLALVAILDAFNCFVLWWQVEQRSRHSTHHHHHHHHHGHGHGSTSHNNHSRIPFKDNHQTCYFPKFGGHDRDLNTCPASTTTTTTTTTMTSWNITTYDYVLTFFSKSWKTPSLSWQITIGVLFCILCIGEAVRQALQARQMAMEMRALDEFEKKLAKLYSVTKRMSVGRLSALYHPQSPNSNSTNHNEHGEDSTNNNPTMERRIEAMVRNTVREWTPVASTLVAWFLLIPWPILWMYLSKNPNRNVEEYYRYDPTFATLWIAQFSTYMSERLATLQEEAVTLAWKIALPFKLWQPILFFQRLRILARWARYFRYAGPLFRLLLKLHDQFWVFTKTWRQTCVAQAERAKRMVRRSMVFSDIQRIESLTKMQTKLASLPSQLLGQAQDIQAILKAKQEEGKKLRRRLDRLKVELFQMSTRSLNGMELYDRVVDLTQEVSRQVKSALWNAHLISPQTRFSVGWRIIVTCTLLSELFRLLMSWELSESFDLRYTDLTRHLLGLCQTKGRPIRNFLGKILHLPQNHPWLDTCRQSSPSSQLSLQVAYLSEIGIDIVGFLDIFVWFYTGELDEMGLIVPKPFFTRCILPGTLTQVLDHPTVPQALPRLIQACWNVLGTVGYGRILRYGLTIAPAVQLFVVDPIYRYLFRPMDEDEYMKYSESLGLMRSFSTTTISFSHRSMASGSLLHPAISLKSIPSRHDDEMDQSLTEENDAYGLFY
mmetsp:Transcript_3378/g.6770  ORF Transcript_3378/g.6770 Transcript_3378/m.6770 type:complete len:738 (+) Transcript_3378:181-2394(+)|eukprot:scaffold4442_cov125-Amphora_coffeaeformis.AAC.31